MQEMKVNELRASGEKNEKPKQNKHACANKYLFLILLRFLRARNHTHTHIGRHNCRLLYQNQERSSGGGKSESNTKMV